jgi:hypothetical protein
MIAQEFKKSPVAAGAAAGEFPLIDELMDEDLAPDLSPSKYIKVMKIDLATFAQNARVHRNTVTRAPSAPSVQKYLRDNVRVICAAWTAAGRNMARAITWYRNEPLPAFDFKTAEQLVAEGRVDDVVHYIESLEAGSAG